MIGDGPLLTACKQLAHGLGLQEAVEFLGIKKPEQVAASMREATAFVQHSMRGDLGNSEGTPLAVLEAGASGLPVVSTRHGGIPDVVPWGKTGFLVDEGDLDGMALWMTVLAKNPALAPELGAAARKHICTNYPLEVNISKLSSLLAACAAQREVAPKNDAHRKDRPACPSH